MDVVKTTSSIGTIIGIYYGVTKGRGFWFTASFALLGAIGGAALGTAYQSVKNYTNK